MLKRIIHRLNVPLLIFIVQILYAQDRITITTDRSSEYMESEFQIGLTHTHSNWQYGNSTAVARAKTNLNAAPINLQNVHIMGWGPGNPNPSPGEYDWSSLDQRIQLMRSMNAEMILTFCTAPGWMKTKGEDWEMNDRVADVFFGEYASLCKKAALRYPDIKYFQIWNEFKGFWNKILNDWDVVKYTEFYNIVYDSVRLARPDATIGGFYKGFSDEMANGGVLTPGDLHLIDYWLKNNVGADFISFDGSIHGWPHVAVSEQALMELSSCFGNIAAVIRERTKLPIWVSEYYAANMVGDAQFQAANHASAYYHSLINGTAVALHWDPVDYAPLLTSTATSGGGQITPHYNVVSIYNTHFGPGRKLYHTTCSDPVHLEVLASATKTLIINKQAIQVSVDLDGDQITIPPYQVILFERADTVDLVESENRYLSDLILPFHLEDPSISMISKNDEVATVDSTGLMTALSPGFARIKVSSEEYGFSDDFEFVLRVQDDTIESFFNFELKVGETDSISSLVEDYTLNSDSMSWSNSDSTVISINAAGMITAASPGDAFINVKITEGLITRLITILITVNEVVVNTSVNLELAIGQITSINTLIDTIDFNGPTPEWSSEDSSIVLIDENGLINAQNAGNTIIKVIVRVDGIRYIYTIHVQVNENSTSSAPGEISAGRIRIYPNPLGSSPLIVDVGSVKRTRVDIYDITGQLCFGEFVLGGRLIIPKGVLSEGVYIISITGKALCWNKTIIVL